MIDRERIAEELCVSSSDGKAWEGKKGTFLAALSQQQVNRYLENVEKLSFLRERDPDEAQVASPKYVSILSNRIVESNRCSSRIESLDFSRSFNGA